MQWIAPTEKDTASATLEKRLWAAADQFRANSGLKAQEYSGPILGLIFLRFAEVRFAVLRARLEKDGASSRRGSRLDEPAAYHAEGILYLPAESRFDYLLHLPEAADIGARVNNAMREIKKNNPQLAGVLPKTYNLFTSTLLKELLKKVSEIPATADYDAFGRIYEYFLGEFARTEGQKGGEFYTPSCIVRLLTEIIEPYHGRILDPACGSGGMFVSSARFVAEHKKNPADELSIHGVEKTDETGRLCRLNLAVHGIEGDIRHGGNVNSYNAGSRSIEELFEELVKLSNSLSEEQQRHVRENMTEEEQVIFDILTRPAPELSAEERAEAKKVAHVLLERLKELLVLNWRQKSAARFQLKLTIEDILDTGLPRAYTPELYQQKCSAVFEHVYESYPERDTSIYAEAV